MVCSSSGSSSSSSSGILLGSSLCLLALGVLQLSSSSAQILGNLMPRRCNVQLLGMAKMAKRLWGDVYNHPDMRALTSQKLQP